MCTTKLAIVHVSSMSYPMLWSIFLLALGTSQFSSPEYPLHLLYSVSTYFTLRSIGIRVALVIRIIIVSQGEKERERERARLNLLRFRRHTLSLREVVQRYRVWFASIGIVVFPLLILLTPPLEPALWPAAQIPEDAHVAGQQRGYHHQTADRQDDDQHDGDYVVHLITLLQRWVDTVTKIGLLNKYYFWKLILSGNFQKNIFQVLSRTRLGGEQW